MRTLCAFQILLGLGTISSGTAGLVLWPQVHNAFIHSLWQGLLFFIAGYWGFGALCRKAKSGTDILVSMALTVTSVPVAIALLTQSLANIMSYMPYTNLYFMDTQLGLRALSLNAVLVDGGLVTCACLQVVTASMTVSRMRKLMRRREEDSMVGISRHDDGATWPPLDKLVVNSFYRSPLGPAPQLQLPVTHAWSYTPSENEATPTDRDRHMSSVYHSGYPLPHLTAAAAVHSNHRPHK